MKKLLFAIICCAGKQSIPTAGCILMEAEENEGEYP